MTAPAGHPAAAARADAAGEVVIRLQGVRKDYSLEQRPWRRLWQQLRGRPGSGPVHHALHGLDLEVRAGETFGVIGRNGAGKSTLLQILAGVVMPSGGRREVKGRVAALLELGAGFNPELTGRENVRLNGPLLGVPGAEMERLLPGIVDFADIGEFVDQPVRSYSTGMFVRLAFAMATAVDPEILIIDEALSVGDGVFARKSFDRIMALRDAGRTVLFCSHSTHHIEAICNRVLWLEAGRAEMIDLPARTVAAYNTFLASREVPHAAVVVPAADAAVAGTVLAAQRARIVGVTASVDGQRGRVLAVESQRSELRVDLDFEMPAGWPAPSMAVGIVTLGGQVVASAGSHNDGMRLQITSTGSGRGSVVFPALPLLKGRYFLRVFLMCERGIHIYEHVENAAELVVSQQGLEQGLVTLPHRWPGALKAH